MTSNKFISVLILLLLICSLVSGIRQQYTQSGQKCMTACNHENWCWTGWGSSNGGDCLDKIDEEDIIYMTSRSEDPNIELCTSHCGKFGYEYQWCFTGDAGKWDYCSTTGRHDIYGHPCTTPCKKWGSSEMYKCNAEFHRQELRKKREVLVSLCAPAPIDLTAIKMVSKNAPDLGINRGMCSSPRHRRYLGVLNYDDVEVMAGLLEQNYPTFTLNDQNNPINSYTLQQAPPQSNAPSTSRGQIAELPLVVRANIYPRHLRTTERRPIPGPINKKMKLMNKHQSDEAGHIVADSLGGPSEEYNFVPQTPSLNRNEGSTLSSDRIPFVSWFSYEEHMREFLREPDAGHIQFTAVIIYGNLLDTRRPVQIGLRLRYYDINNTFVDDSLNCFFSNEYGCLGLDHQC